jgi:hypothetical protein
MKREVSFGIGEAIEVYLPLVYGIVESYHTINRMIRQLKFCLHYMVTGYTIGYIVCNT